MKKIINFFKMLFKCIIGFIEEYIGSKAKIQNKKTDKKEIIKIKKEIEYINVIGSLPDSNNELSIYRQKLQYYKNNVKTNEKEIDILIEKINNIIQKIDKKEIKNIESKKEVKNIEINKPIKKGIAEKEILKDYIKVTTQLIDQYKEDYKYYIKKENKNDLLNELYYKVKKVMSDYKKMEAKGLFLNVSFEIKKIDKYNLLKNESKIQELLTIIENAKKENIKKEPTKEMLKEKKVGINSKKEKYDELSIQELKNKKLNKKDEEKKISKEEIDKNKKEEQEKKKQEKEKLKKEIKEIEASLKIIKNNIYDNEMIVKYTKNNPSKLGHGLNVLLNQSMKIGLSLFPMSLFQNKAIGGLTSAVLLNNTIRGMRRSLNSEVEYIKLSKSDYLTNASINSKTEIISNNTLSQINSLKLEIRTQYYLTNDNELKNMYFQIEMIEEELIKAKEEEQKRKGKPKVKINQKNVDRR